MDTEKHCERYRHLAALIAATAGADHAAFQALHALTHDCLYGVALRRMRCPGMAEDVLQDAYLSIWVHAGTFRPGGGSPMTWLIAIVEHRALSVLRSQRRAPVIFGIEVEGTDRHGEAHEPVPRARLTRALARLEPAQRQSIALAFGREMTHAEVARHMGVPLGTAKSWLRRGLERLRACLEPATVTAEG